MNLIDVTADFNTDDKRGIVESYHKVSIEHLDRYHAEFTYRFNRRDEQEQLFEMTARNLLNGKNLPYKTPTRLCKCRRLSAASTFAFIFLRGTGVYRKIPFKALSNCFFRVSDLFGRFLVCPIEFFARASALIYNVFYHSLVKHVEIINGRKLSLLATARQLFVMCMRTNLSFERESQLLHYRYNFTMCERRIPPFTHPLATAKSLIVMAGFDRNQMLVMLSTGEEPAIYAM